MLTWIPEGGAFGVGPDGNLFYGTVSSFYERIRVGELVWIPTKYETSTTWEVALVLDVCSHPVPPGSPADMLERVELNVTWLWRASDVADKYDRGLLSKLQIPVPTDDAQRAAWYYLTNWTQNVWADTITTHAEFVLGDAPEPDPLHRGVVRILGFIDLASAKRGRQPKGYVRFEQDTDLFALLGSKAGTMRDPRYHDQQQLWRTGVFGVFGAPQTADPFDAVELELIKLSSADASKGAVIMMGANARAGVIHGIAYAADGGAERRGFAVGRTPGGALRVRALYTVAELCGCEDATTSSGLLKRAARAARTICARPGKKRHWFLYEREDVELIVGVDEVDVPVERVLSPFLVVSPSYVPFLLGEYPEARLHVFELGVDGDDGLVSYPHPSLERRLEAIQELIYPTAGADAHLAVQEQIKAAVRGHTASGKHQLSPAKISLDMNVRDACTLSVWPGLDVSTGRGPLRLGGEYDGGAGLVATDLGGLSHWTIAPTKRNRRDGEIWGPPGFAFVSERAATVNYFLEEKRLELTVSITVMDPKGNRLPHSAAFPDPPTGGPPVRWNPIDRCWEPKDTAVQQMSLEQAYRMPAPYWGTTGRFKSVRRGM